jgi:ribosomal protein S20
MVQSGGSGLAPSARGRERGLWYHPRSHPGSHPAPGCRLTCTHRTNEVRPLAKTPRTWTGARTPSGLKRVRQAQRRHAVLGPRRSAAKTYVAKTLAVVARPADADEATASLIEALSALDRAAKAGAIHPNAAARRKSRLTRKVNAALGGANVQTSTRVTKTTGKAAAAKAAKARIAAGKSTKAKGAQTAAGKARAALSKTARDEAAAAKAAQAAATEVTETAPAPKVASKASTTKKPAAKATASKPAATAKAAPKKKAVTTKAAKE